MRSIPRRSERLTAKVIFHIPRPEPASVYCVGWDLYDLLMQGFKGVSGKVESKPGQDLRSALGQVVNFFYTLQGGGGRPGVFQL